MTVSVISASRIPVANFRPKDSAIVSSFVRVFFRRVLNYHPRIPEMHGLPKTHKPAVPHRPIVSFIGSAQHQLSKVISKIITPLLGSQTAAHLKNSKDLSDRISNLNVKNKQICSLDIKSLYTNVLLEKSIHALSKVLEQTKTSLPIPITKHQNYKIMYR